MKTSTLHVINQPAPAGCRCHWCERPAVMVERWRTEAMKGLSFSYACLEHCGHLSATEKGSRR